MASGIQDQEVYYSPRMYKKTHLDNCILKSVDTVTWASEEDLDVMVSCDSIGACSRAKLIKKVIEQQMIYLGVSARRSSWTHSSGPLTGCWET